jgi:hypothetical protein
MVALRISARSTSGAGAIVQRPVGASALDMGGYRTHGRGLMKRLVVIAIAALGLAVPALAEGTISRPNHVWRNLASTRAARTASPKVAEFFVAGAPGVGCFMEGGPCGTVGCYTESRSFQQKAIMNATGEVQVCARHVHAFADACELGNAGIGTPTYRSGKRIAVGAFRCQIVSAGVKCIVIASGKGFYMTAHHVTSIGAASIVAPPLHLREFLSPDHSVWCVLEDRGCGTYPTPPTRSAEIDDQGGDTFCDVPELTTPPAGHEPEGCFQNWNGQATVLRYGQSDLYDGLLCKSATEGITCTLVSGAGEGKGFRINKSEAVEVG